MGLESTPEEYIAKMVEVFRDVRRILRDDGTLWLNIGDSYSDGGKGGGGAYMDERGEKAWGPRAGKNGWRSAPPGLKHKDLCCIPWLLALALRADGWYLRQDIIWAKPNPMPESVTDRCTKSHEYLFLLTKSAKYYFDHDAIKEPCAESSVARWDQDLENQKGSDRVPGKTNGPMKAVGGPASWKGSEFHTGKTAEHQLGRASKNRSHKGVTEYESSDTEEHRTKAGSMKIAETAYPTRNKRDVWTVATQPYKEAHFATFPPKLIEPCILAGCPENGVVLDPFCGSGTTGVVALRHKRDFIGIELNPAYAELARKRIDNEAPMFNDVSVRAPDSADPW
jgi:DNA modification methylase